MAYDTETTGKYMVQTTEYTDNYISNGYIHCVIYTITVRRAYNKQDSQTNHGQCNPFKSLAIEKYIPEVHGFNPHIRIKI